MRLVQIPILAPTANILTVDRAHAIQAVMKDFIPMGATILTTQLPVEHWHSWLGDPTIADAILDRLLSREQRIHLKGESLRRTTQEPAADEGGHDTDN